MNIIILFIAIISLIVLSRRFGIASFMGAGFVGFFIYSIPAFINKARYFWYLNSDFYIYEPSFKAMLVYLIAWFTFFLCVVSIPDVSRYKNYHFNKGRRFSSIEFLWSGVFLSTCFATFIVFYSGDMTDSVGVIYLIGRWVVALTLIAAFAYRSLIAFIYLFVILLYWFFSGDRTLLGITLVSMLVLFAQRLYQSTYVSFYKLFNFKFFTVFFGLLFVIIFGKAIYIGVAESRIDLIQNKIANLNDFLSKSFEPMIIFNHVQYVVDTSFQIPVIDFLESIFSNFLIYPSAFGQSTNVYSQQLISSFPISMSYGVAGNYWAHAYSVFGFIGVVFFALIFVFSLYACDRVFLARARPIAILFALLGGLIAIYTFRNGLDNFLSFLRQIFIAYFLIRFVSFFIRAILPFKKRCSLTSDI